MDKFNFNFEKFELEENESPKLKGTAILFNCLPDDGRKIKFEKTAFDRAILENDVRAFYNHNTDELLGRLSSGTLKLNSTETGIDFELDLPNTQKGKDVLELAKRRDLTGCSFGGYVTEYNDENGVTNCKEFDLQEISLVVFPAFEQTEIRFQNEKEKQKWFDYRNRMLKMLQILQG